jgi:hypothetical protein
VSHVLPHTNPPPQADQPRSPRKSLWPPGDRTLAHPLHSYLSLGALRGWVAGCAGAKKAEFGWFAGKLPISVKEALALKEGGDRRWARVCWVTVAWADERRNWAGKGVL